ncbi:IclR family transcriptional regulator [Martelella mediterranea]|uniref:IclR family transcriptional regulator n=1 Tax=Martelella mediterranea TaxID=293089 RepID=UPI001E4BB42D|nr:IclR family transcriptional regulator [Martelella mediterranea]MCD1635795.1 IclR family transcriptional regulator [Martelella mediterranea]
MTIPTEPARSSSDGSKLPSVDKSLRVLLALAEAGFGGVDLRTLSARLGINKSSLHTSISALRFRGFVSQSPDTRRYYLGPAIADLSQIYMRRYDLRSLLRPGLMRLTREINEVCYMSQLDGTEILYLERTESRRPIQPGIQNGTRLLAVNTAMGRTMIAAAYEDFDSFARIFGPGYQPRTAHAPPTIEAAWQEIEAVRRRGFGIDRQENVEGLTAVAVGIVNGGAPVASVSVVSLASDPGADEPLRHLDRLRQIIAESLQPPMEIFQAHDQNSKGRRTYEEMDKSR